LDGTKVEMDAIDRLILDLPQNASILDIGCFGFIQVKRAQRLGRSDIKHAGVDSRSYAGLPPGFEFKQSDADLNGLPFESDRFDLIIASHVIEHLRSPIGFFGDCLRVCKPNGLVYVEAPSERSLWLPGSPIEHEKFFSLSFFDDPTHVGRPWTPQALHRLAAGYGAEIVQARHITARRALLRLPFVAIRSWLTKKGGEQLERTAWLAFGWACYLIARKVQAGTPEYVYSIPPR
jgi:SAM-dependent methyltransferase